MRLRIINCLNFDYVYSKEIPGATGTKFYHKKLEVL